MLTDEEKKLCLDIARSTIGHKLGLITPKPECPEGNIFQQKFGMFVSLHKKGNLRGCIGYIKPYNTLYKSLVDLSLSAAFADTRFTAVQKSEFADLEIEISLLSPLYEVKNTDEIMIGRDGLYIQHPLSSGLLLPQVATKYDWDRDTFLLETCRKAGLPTSYLKDEATKIYRFEAEIFS